MTTDWRAAERAYDDAVIGDTTLGRLFADAAERHAGETAQLYKGGIYDRSMVPGVLPAAPDGRFAPVTYRKMAEIVRHLATGFRELGVGAGDRVAIFAGTRMEWAHADLSLLSAGAVVTTVYPGSSPGQVEFLLSDPGATGVVVENGELLERVLAAEDALDLDFIVAMDEVAGHDDREDVHTLADVHDLGREAHDGDAFESWLDDRALSDPASIIYTSGTTGRPKGVVLTHGNLRANVNQVRRRFGPRPDRPADVPSIDDDARTVSFLPLAHVFERLAGHLFMFASGATVAYAESPDTLQEDFAQVRPTTGTSVPRVYEKIYDAIREEAGTSPVRERVFRWATGVGRRYHEADDPGPFLSARQAVADRLVFSQVREALGGEIDFLISGGGSLSAELCALYYAMGLPIYEGYGLTETSPVLAANPPEAPKVGTIGPPLVDVELRVDETVVPEGEFEDAGGETGELLARGPNVFEGYWNLPEATEEAFATAAPASAADGGAATAGRDDAAAEQGNGDDASGGEPADNDADAGDSDDGGWFRTGDIVTVRPDGYLVFRERSKELLVLSTGKNVAPGPIEDGFAASEVVEQVMVVGDGEKFVGAIVVPDVAGIRKWADRNDRSVPDDPAEMVEDAAVRERVERAVEEVNAGFERHERIKRFVMVAEEFTEENDLLTPTMKKKRRNILDRYADEVAALYED